MSAVVSLAQIGSALERSGHDQRTVADAARKLTGTSFLDGTPNAAANWWYFEVFGIKVYCWNFHWRQDALFYHDLHHVVTGYPCTMSGECQVATWEFSAGRYPNLFANLFCLPLVFLGMLIAPRKTFDAFFAGQRSTSLFGRNLGLEVMAWPIAKLALLTERKSEPAAYRTQILKFCSLVCASSMITFAGPALLAFAFL